MEFYINQNDTSPILKMEVINDGRTKSHKTFNEDLDNAIIKFSMKDTSNGMMRVIMNNAYITKKNTENPDSPKEYYIFYKWLERDTKYKGRFLGEFHITNSTGELISPISEPLYINIV
jgi:K+/H+ antiporter YhaU regulatory subunit KhtT